eukprot:11010068-Alexandrium_andersonii.AAC.1
MLSPRVPPSPLAHGCFQAQGGRRFAPPVQGTRAHTWCGESAWRSLSLRCDGRVRPPACDASRLFLPPPCAVFAS